MGELHALPMLPTQGGQGAGPPLAVFEAGLVLARPERLPQRHLLLERAVRLHLRAAGVMLCGLHEVELLLSVCFCWKVLSDLTCMQAVSCCAAWMKWGCC